MITYNRSAFALNLLFRVHGSAIYRAILPGCVAVGVYLLVRFVVHEGDASQSGAGNLGHPYAIGVVVTGATFTIVFRASQGYSRYWEACSAIYHMSSKWQDTACHTAVYHMQNDRYDHIKPPSFYDYPELTNMFLTRDRERVKHLDESEALDSTGAGDLYKNSMRGDIGDDSVRESVRALHRSINVVDDKHRKGINQRSLGERMDSRRVVSMMEAGGIMNDLSSPLPLPLLGPGKWDGNWGALFGDGKATFYDKDEPAGSIPHKMGFASVTGGHTTPLFLQELAHLASLLNAVALSTLRNDVDGAESPLDCYEPGAPWPEVDPLQCHDNSTHSWADPKRFFFEFLGFGRTPEQRTRYNAMRPLPVIGGVSDNEIRFLQMARGPYAKTQLCWYWFSEYIMREHLAGSLGTVGAPILSRVMQFVGDGMIYYNHARKIMFIPFPFVHAQLSAVFVIVIVFAVPFMMDQYTGEIWLGIFLSFFAVTCLSGIHEVARELENPFRNVPNELPVVTLQAQFNEALLTMYSGYHPDHYWNTPTNMSHVSALREAREKGKMPESGPPTNTTTSDNEISTDSQKRHTKRHVQRAPSGRVAPEPAPTENGIHAPTGVPEVAASAASAPESLSSPTAPLPSEDNTVEQLQSAVLQQGKMMERLMEEQIRLNRMLSMSLEKKTN